MESEKIEKLLEKYFEGKISYMEEKELRTYFSSSNVKPHLEQYKLLFVNSTENLVPKLKQKKSLFINNANSRVLFIVVSVFILFGIATFWYQNYEKANQNQDLGTYTDPELAFKETKKALDLLSNQVNVGIESVYYVQEFENSKKIIFKQ
jgi:hypothetical protein